MPFQGVVGHRAIVGLLSRAVARDTLPPSLIFAGPKGIGKRRTAVALAEALNCRSPVLAIGETAETALSIDACGKCSACTRIARGIHSDVVIIEPEESGSIKVHQVRELIERTAYRPFEGKRRVAIIDEAEALMESAQNALLKTLEEPPPSSVFVLVTSSPDVLLPTVRSRCPRLRFGRLSPAEVSEVLRGAGASRATSGTPESRGRSTADVQALAAMADGSPGQALERGSAQVSDAREAAARFLAGVAPSPDPRRRLKEAEAFLGKPSAREGPRAHLALRLEALSTLLRDAQVLATKADARLLANTDLHERVGSAVRAFDRERLGRAFASVVRALGALDRNASPKVVADWIALQI